jgi:ADP-heptose:LPS heptosyltransferase
MITPKNLLIIRTDRIGDVVLTLPLARVIKERFPECKITFLVREYTKPILYKHPYIDEVLVLKEDNNKINLSDNIREIKALKFDACITVYPTFDLARMTWLAGIKHRIGTGYRWYSFLFNHKVYEHRKYGEKHELEHNLRLLNFFGIDDKAAAKNISFDIHIDEKSSEKVDAVLKTKGVDVAKKLLIIHGGSGGSAVDLPIPKMRELAALLNGLSGIYVLLTGNEKEKAVCKELEAGENVINLAGEFDLRELMALISQADVLIANSTGPIHLAAAMGKFTVGFYPKIKSCSKERWGPYTEKKAVFTPDLECGNCSRKQCERLNCMNYIDVSKAFAAVREYIKI